MADNKKLMAKAGIEKGQVVWAKLGGYPWWPGIVRDTQVDDVGEEAHSKDASSEFCRLTVKFIGENTHASLPSSKVVDFEDFLLDHSRTKKQHLLRCIEYAKKFANGDLDITDLPAINERLEKKHHGRNASDSPERVTKTQKVEEGKRKQVAKQSEHSWKPKKVAPETGDGKKDVTVLVAVKCKDKRPAAALLPANPITWNSVPSSFSVPIKPPSAAQSADVKLPDSPSAAKLIKAVSLPYLRQAAPVHNQVSLAQNALVSFLRTGSPSAAEITKGLLSLFQVDFPTTGLPRFLRILKHFFTSLPDVHRPLSRLAQKLFFALKQQEVTQTLRGILNLPDSPPSVRLLTVQRQPDRPDGLSASSSVEIPSETIPIRPQSSSDTVPMIKDDGSTCSVDIAVPDMKVEDFGETTDTVSFPESEEFVADREKRRRVCTVVYRILAANHFSVAAARELALKMEQRLRRKDPSMSEKYSAQYKKMIRDIRALTPQVLNQDN